MKIDLLNKIKRETERIEKGIIEWRRYFHKYPELGFEEYKTSEKVHTILKKTGIPFEVKAKTGVVGYIDIGADITVGLRADMDALPVEERTGLSFASVHKGIMHACGHDGHTATLLGVASVLKTMKRYLKVNVKLIFQPSEERSPCGAPLMIKEGVLKGVDYLLGFHFFPQLPIYKIWIGKGPVMAATDYFKITIKGKGGHGSSPHLTSDTIVCAGYLITALQTIVSRSINPMDNAVISVCSVKGGDAFNVIPEIVELTGTVRTLKEDVREKIIKEIEKKVYSVCDGYGCKADIVYKSYSPLCVNDEKLAEKINQITKGIVPCHLFDFHPIMGGEDFAFFSQKVPSVYLFVGIGDKYGPNHSPTFSIDERILPYTVSFLSTLIVNF
ncbi:MAG: amidohydrolase [Candidatus Omnitrophica bacterium]|nr:amidohydrolase [Candidatus Omnitrophota bacterium]